MAKPGRGDDVVAAFEDEMFAIFDAEPGTEQYVLSRSLADPDLLWCSELFTSRTAFDKHRNTALSKRFVPRLQELLVSSEATIGSPVKASGAAL
jgi:quinol monooxygenase YgiN